MMYGLTLTQPWATLMEILAKQYETRSWGTPYRGLIAIHAAKGFSREDVRLVLQREPFKTTLSEAGYPLFSLLPRGSIVAVGYLVNCLRIPKEETHFRRIPQEPHPADVHDFFPDFVMLPPRRDTLEFAFGDYAPGRFAWIFYNVRRLKEPVPCRGALSLWNVPAEIERAINEQLGVNDGTISR